MRSLSRLRVPAGVAAALLLAGCSVVSGRGPATPGHVANRPTVAPPAGPLTPAQIAAIPDAVPRIETRSRSGNPPFYDVLGRHYTLLATPEGYVERGVASWYGPGFHGVSTSLGEP